ncbi:SsgA family sporulation/cell division regulator [Streptomyces bobili]|uniref:SsgA family sporulation/cell division regulator n=1 Tax=Streptomyces bobili TaxID=67280 RepID=UPI0037999F9B
MTRPFLNPPDRDAEASAGKCHEKADNVTPMVCRMLVCLLGADEMDVPLPVDLRYDIADPYAVYMTFHLGPHETRQWVMGRDLLMSGQQQLTGLGDVRAWPSRRRGVSTMCISIGAPEEAVVLEARALTLDAFLRRTLDLVPRGTEHQYLNLDDIANRLLSAPDEPHP